MNQILNPSLASLRDIFLKDEHDDEAVVMNVRGAEHGLDYLEITTQTLEQYRNNLKTIHKVYTEEV